MYVLVISLRLQRYGKKTKQIIHKILWFGQIFRMTPIPGRSGRTIFFIFYTFGRCVHIDCPGCDPRMPRYGIPWKTSVRSRTGNGTECILRLQRMPRHGLFVAVRPYCSPYRGVHLHLEILKPKERSKETLRNAVADTPMPKVMNFHEASNPVSTAIPLME